MTHLINNFKIQQIIFFVLFLSISIFFGAGGDGTYIPFAVFFGPFAAPMAILQMIPESIKIQNGSFFIMISILVNTFFIVIQPFVYYKILKKFILSKNFDGITKICKIHFVCALSLTSIFIINEINHVKLLYVFLGMFVSIIFNSIYWVIYLKSIKY